MKDAQHRLPPLFQKNEVLFGHDVTMGLLAFESDGDGQIKIFARDGSSKRAETAPFQPFMLLAGRCFQRLAR